MKRSVPKPLVLAAGIALALVVALVIPGAMRDLPGRSPVVGFPARAEGPGIGLEPTPSPISKGGVPADIRIRASSRSPEQSRAEALAERRSRPVAALRREWSSAEDEEERSLLADALVLKGSPASLGALLELLREASDPLAREQLIERLIHLTSPESLDFLASEALQARDPAVLRAVIGAAGRMGTPRSVEWLVRLYRDELPIRGQMRMASRALSEIANPRSARTVAALAVSAPEPGLIEAAAHSLAKMGTTAAVQGLLDASRNLRVQTDAGLQRTLLTMLARSRTPQNLAFRRSLGRGPLSAEVRHALLPSHSPQP